MRNFWKVESRWDKNGEKDSFKHTHTTTTNNNNNFRGNDRSRNTSSSEYIANSGTALGKLIREMNEEQQEVRPPAQSTSAALDHRLNPRPA